MKTAREVNAFRRVVTVLAAPAPAVYRSVLFAGASPLLSPELPMVDESPFAALPDGAGIPGEDGGSGAAVRRAAALAAASPGLARQQDESALAPSVSPGGANASAPPVFSFRRPAQRNAAARFEPVAAAAPPLARVPTGVLGTAPASFPASGSAAGAALNTACEEVGRLADALLSGARRETTNSVAADRSLRKCEELPKTEIPTPWGDTKSSGGPSERVVGLLMRPPSVENPRFSAVLISSHLLTVAAPNAHPRGTAVPERAQSGAGQSSPSFAPVVARPAVGRLELHASGELAPRPAPSAPASFPETGPAPRTAWEEVGRLAGALLSPAAESSAAFPSPGQPPPHSSEPSQSHRVLAPPPADERPRLGDASLGDLDAEWLAALVNDVLAEQARRHGVDLS